MPEEFDDFGIPIKRQSVVSENDTHDEFGIPVKKKDLAEAKEPSGNDSPTPTEKPKQPSLKSGAETKSFTEKIATNDLPQTFAKQQTKGRTDAEIQAEKRAKIPTSQEAQAQARIKAKEESKPLLDEIAMLPVTASTIAIGIFLFCALEYISAIFCSFSTAFLTDLASFKSTPLSCKAPIISLDIPS